MRVYIKRIAEYNTEAVLMKNEIKGYLKISALKGVAVYWGIDIIGLTSQEIQASRSLF